ncbi:MAG: hypothetical protein K5917_00425 [Clostridiales bacterium]|nr:hypothetical protein [Clostridiales bacterium]
MKKIKNLITDIIEILENNEALESVTFLREFPSGARPAPLRSLKAAIGIENQEFSPATLGNSTIIECKTTLGIKLYAPYNFNSENIVQIFFDILNTIAQSGEYQIISCSNASITPNRATDCVVIEGKVTLSLLIKDFNEE